jgi:hypothetical protein
MASLIHHILDCYYLSILSFEGMQVDIKFPAVKFFFTVGN